MPRKTEVQHRHPDPAPKPKRKVKPAFDLPPEVVAAPADVGWVRREVEAPATVVEFPSEVLEVAVEMPARHETISSGPMAVVVLTGVGAVTLAIVTTGIASAAVFGLIAGPVFIARRFI